MPPKPKFALTANEVKYALHKMFPAPEWLAVEELYIQGFKRYVDFWAIRIDVPVSQTQYLPEFRFLSIYAIEIKVNRADFKSELKEPSKRLGGELFSNYFSFAAPRGVIELDEIPEGIGYIEIQGNKAKMIRLAEYSRAEPPDWAFIASLGRALQR